MEHQAILHGALLRQQEKIPAGYVTTQAEVAAEASLKIAHLQPRPEVLAVEGNRIQLLLILAFLEKLVMQIQVAAQEVQPGTMETLDQTEQMEVQESLFCA